MAKRARISCSSSIPGGECENAVNGISRKIKDDTNCWISEAVDGEWLAVKFGKTVSVSQVHLKFDSNLSKELMISLSRSTLSEQIPGIPPQLVKDYSIEFYKDGKLVYTRQITGNYMRFTKHDFSFVECSSVKVRVSSTHGDPHARIFEIRVYGDE